MMNYGNYNLCYDNRLVFNCCSKRKVKLIYDMILHLLIDPSLTCGVCGLWDWSSRMVAHRLRTQSRR